MCCRVLFCILPSLWAWGCPLGTVAGMWGHARIPGTGLSLGGGWKMGQWREAVGISAWERGGWELVSHWRGRETEPRAPREEMLDEMQDKKITWLIGTGLISSAGISVLNGSAAEGTWILTVVPVLTAKTQFTGSVTSNQEPTARWWMQGHKPWLHIFKQQILHILHISDSNKKTELKDPPDSIKYLPASMSNRLWMLDGQSEWINNLLCIISWLSSRNKSCLISVNMTQDYSSSRGWDLFIESGAEQGYGGRRLGEDLCQGGCTGGQGFGSRKRGLQRCPMLLTCRIQHMTHPQDTFPWKVLWEATQRAGGVNPGENQAQGGSSPQKNILVGWGTVSSLRNK